MTEQSLAGSWAVELSDGSRWTLNVPGTLDESGIGYQDVNKSQVRPDGDLGKPGEQSDGMPIATRFTRRYTYEGPASISRSIDVSVPEGSRIFLDVERARCLRLVVDGREIEPFEQQTLSTPHCFELTGLEAGKHEFTLISDNSYPGLPHDDIVYSSAATDETQTNWNGLLGYVRLRTESAVFIDRLRVYPRADGVTVKVEVDAAVPYAGMIELHSDALAADVRKAVRLDAGKTELEFDGLVLAQRVQHWDEDEGNLYVLTARLSDADEKSVTFGVRTFGADHRGRLALNGRAIFLRSEANCAVFPETGYSPMTEAEWLDILRRYRSYGVNCVRFHSHCPPEAAFYAADKLGIMMQPELSHWNPRDAFISAESYAYYRRELTQLLLALANHPSFVMLTLGNELRTDAEGHRRMDELLELARGIDPTRLYARGSNEHYGAIGCGDKGDFYTAQKYFEHDLRGTFAGFPGAQGRIQGHINNQYPNARTDYSPALDELRKKYRKPVFSFEVGQFEVLPDFRELDEFHGVTDPANYRLIRDRVLERGIEDEWARCVSASGELARLCYREEIEAAMRTRDMSGISLLGLQDFPGQGTALVGMLNAHLEPKPYPFAQPEAFSTFFRAQLPLVRLERYTYEIGEMLCAQVELANYGKLPVCGEMAYALEGGGRTVMGTLGEVNCPCGENTDVGVLEIPLTGYDSAAELNLTVHIGQVRSSYKVWVYPQVTPVCPPQVHETRHFDSEALRVLSGGGCVYLAPDSTNEQLPNSIQAQFSTDFWSVGTFTAQPGGMGQLIDERHPLFEGFPTSFHTDWQWWPMAVQRAIVLPRDMHCIVAELDSYAYLRPMAKLVECRCGGGRLLVSSMGLHNLLKYPEARALQASIYRYLASERFAPCQELSIDEVRKMVI